MYLQKEEHSHRLKLIGGRGETELSFSLWTTTYTVADGPVLKHQQILKPVLTANLQDGCILYNISHLHHISTYECDQIEKHNIVLFR